jgi:hypothetical protein
MEPYKPVSAYKEVNECAEAIGVIEDILINYNAVINTYEENQEVYSYFYFILLPHGRIRTYTL